MLTAWLIFSRFVADAPYETNRYYRAATAMPRAALISAPRRTKKTDEAWSRTMISLLRPGFDGERMMLTTSAVAVPNSNAIRLRSDGEDRSRAMLRLWDAGLALG